MDVKKIFLVDYENVASAGAKGCEHLKKHDKIIIFISNKRMSAKSAQAYITTKARIVTKHVDSGKPDALDFQLLAYAGVKCSNKKNKNKQYYIVSKDKSYEYGVNMLARLGFDNVQCVTDISGAFIKNKEIDAENKSDETVNEILSVDTIPIEKDADTLLSDNKSESALLSECETKSDIVDTEIKSDTKNQMITNIQFDNSANDMAMTGFKKIMTILRDKCKIPYNTAMYLSIIDSFRRTRNKMGLFNSLRYKYPSDNNKCDIYTIVKPYYSELKQAAQTLDYRIFSNYEVLNEHLDTYCHKLNQLLHVQYSVFATYMIGNAVKHSHNKAEFVRYVQAVYYGHNQKMPSWYSNAFKKEFARIQHIFLSKP